MPDYDWKKSMEKALWDLAHSLVGVVGAAALVYLSDPANWQALIHALPVEYAVPAGLVLSAGTAFLRNYLKHGDK